LNDKAAIFQEMRINIMQKYKQFTAIFQSEGDGYVSLCPELDIASQGETVEKARANLAEALELFFEHVSDSEIDERLHNEVFISRWRTDHENSRNYLNWRPGTTVYMRF
jgi:predicted RNase H-like HicB family nuclease